MKFYYQSYLRAFIKFAQGSLDKAKSFQEIGRYAVILHQKVEQLIRRASTNSKIYLVDLQKELYEIGREYIRKFSRKFGQGLDPDLSKKQKMGEPVNRVEGKGI